MRLYENLWYAIRDSKVYSIEVPEDSHKTIIQAVRKEKHRDSKFRLLAAKQNKRYKLKEHIQGNIITFYLEDCSLLGTLK